MHFLPPVSQHRVLSYTFCWSSVDSYLVTCHDESQVWYADRVLRLKIKSCYFLKPRMVYTFIDWNSSFISFFQISLSFKCVYKHEW